MRAPSPLPSSCGGKGARVNDSSQTRRLESDFHADVEDVVALLGLDLVQCMPAGDIQGDLLVGEGNAGTGAADTLMREVAGLDRALVVKDEQIGEALDELM